MLSRVVVVLCFLVGTAAAEIRQGPRCFDEYKILPAEGSRDVPLNAKVWILGDHAGTGYRLRGRNTNRALTAKEHAPAKIVERPLGELRANTTYEGVCETTVLTRFTTATTWDTR